MLLMRRFSGCWRRMPGLIAESFGQSGNQSSTQASHISCLHDFTPTHAHRMLHVRRCRQPQVSLTWITVLSYLFIRLFNYLIYILYTCS